MLILTQNVSEAFDPKTERFEKYFQQSHDFVITNQSVKLMNIHATNFLPVHRAKINLKTAVIDPERCIFFAHIGVGGW